jgi:Flp pilus assembly pilin Flp
VPRSLVRQKGVAAVEFGLLAILLVLMVFGMTELGRAFYQYNTLLKSTRTAARELSFGAQIVHGPRAQCLAVYGTTTCSCTNSNTLLPGLACGLVSFSYLSSGISAGCVTIGGYQFVSYLPWIVPDIEFAPLKTCMRTGAS